METKVNPWKANLTNGLILGLAFIVFTLVLYFFDLTFNKSVGYLIWVIDLVLLFILLKSYRDNNMHGYITYGQSVGAGVIIFLYYSIIAAVFIYILYKFIDPDLTKKMLAAVEEQLMKTGKIPAEQMDTVMNMQRKIMRPEILAPASIINNMLFGTVLSLIISIFIRKEGNPLIDTPVNQ